VVLDVGYGAANPDPSQTFYYGMEMNARAVLYDYVYFFPKFLPKHVNLSGVQLATNIRGAVIRLETDQSWSLEVAMFDELAKTLPPEPGSFWTTNLNRNSSGG